MKHLMSLNEYASGVDSFGGLDFLTAKIKEIITAEHEKISEIKEKIKKIAEPKLIDIHWYSDSTVNIEKDSLIIENGAEIRFAKSQASVDAWEKEIGAKLPIGENTAQKIALEFEKICKKELNIILNMGSGTIRNQTLNAL